MKIAVTGANGFIGSHICQELLRRGHEVVSLVRPDLDSLRTLTQKIIGINTMVHCAWSGHPRNEVEGQRNIYTSLTVAKAAGLVGTKHFIFMSSGGGIGNRTSYSSSKLEVESLLSSDFDLFDFNLTVLAPTAVFGPNQDVSKGLGAVSIFLDSIRHDKTIHILGSPFSGRDFLHVLDLAELTTTIIERPVYGTFEVGGPEVVELFQLIKYIEESLGKKAKVQIENATGNDPQIVCLDNTLITKATGWVPKRTVLNYLKELRSDDT